MVDLLLIEDRQVTAAILSSAIASLELSKLSASRQRALKVSGPPACRARMRPQTDCISVFVTSLSQSPKAVEPFDINFLPVMKVGAAVLCANVHIRRSLELLQIPDFLLP